MYESFIERIGKSFFNVFAAFCLVAVSSAFAQTTGNLQGIVRDPNGAVVVG